MNRWGRQCWRAVWGGGGGGTSRHLRGGNRAGFEGEGAGKQIHSLRTLIHIPSCTQFRLLGEAGGGPEQRISQLRK